MYKNIYFAIIICNNVTIEKDAFHAVLLIFLKVNIRTMTGFVKYR